MMDSEGDPRKAADNLAKHGISFHDAATVFGDQFALTYYDPDHSIDEDRYLTFGVATNGAQVVVSHTDRGKVTRIISARPMIRRERIHYEREK
jgi:uncharacterized DUF497 family protein